MLSLAEHRQISLDIKPVSHLPADYNVHRASIRNSLTKQLNVARFDVVDEPDGSVPVLRLRLSAGIDEGVPDAVLCIQDLRFEKPLYFERLDRKLVVPTYVKTRVMMEPSENIAKSFQTNLQDLFKGFIADVSAARNHFRDPQE